MKFVPRKINHGVFDVANTLIFLFLLISLPMCWFIIIRFFIMNDSEWFVDYVQMSLSMFVSITVFGSVIFLVYLSRITKEIIKDKKEKNNFIEPPGFM